MTENAGKESREGELQLAEALTGDRSSLPVRAMVGAVSYG